MNFTDKYTRMFMETEDVNTVITRAKEEWNSASEIDQLSTINAAKKLRREAAHMCGQVVNRTDLRLYRGLLDIYKAISEFN